MSVHAALGPTLVGPRDTDPPLRLAEHAVAVPAVASNVRPSLVLPERQARALLTAAQTRDVGRGGTFSAGPAGVQVWSGPFDGAGGTRGSATHLGSVDWSYDTPTRHYATIYRVMITASGVEAGESVVTVLGRVLALVGEPLPPLERLSRPSAPPRDPFRSGRA